ncbi:ribonuclease [Lysobacter sp. 5GHs7-4]|uniref:ribonuclease domain-containing protein n=1 Tax=Lysobacter sp. 5GHs7-4 TaxID=2904253 RepID=UPI001E40588A|nr:ribonuclease domain-containing protein [Lysobacter sp. 5GHs7-4]UHQ23496.1 ribonuclease [Lysobacter sp. 5GHs7-4]
MRRAPWLIVAVVLLGLWLWSQRQAPLPASDAPGASALPLPGAGTPTPAPRAPATSYPDFLPVEAHDVLGRIARGGPYAHRQDGGTFQNRERRLPSRPRGYYREYTVETPGSDDRGARRIVTGGDPPSEYYYSDDHYRSFRRFYPSGAAR